MALYQNPGPDPSKNVSGSLPVGMLPGKVVVSGMQMDQEPVHLYGNLEQDCYLALVLMAGDRICPGFFIYFLTKNPSPRPYP